MVWDQGSLTEVDVRHLVCARILKASPERLQYIPCSLESGAQQLKTSRAGKGSPASGDSSGA